VTRQVKMWCMLWTYHTLHDYTHKTAKIVYAVTKLRVLPRVIIINVLQIVCCQSKTITWTF